MRTSPTFDFAARLRSVRAEKQLSQAQLSTAIGVTQETISKWERGRSEPTVSVIPQIADALGVSTSYLLGPMFLHAEERVA